jgi:hypothetical protein
MPRNPYIRDVPREQQLINDINAEVIRAMGRNVYYIPRTLNNEDKLFGEDATNSFNTSYLIEMYHEDSQAFGGDGDIISKFGIEVRDKIVFRVSKRTFKQIITKEDSTIVRPKEGDLIYYPLSKTIFEITFVEHENPLYQLGELYTFVLFAETFAYNNESFNTGITDVDTDFALARKKTAQIFTMGDWTLQSGTTSQYFVGEDVFQIAGSKGSSLLFADQTAKAEVISWNSNTKELAVSNISGSFLTGTAQAILGRSSTGERYLSGTADSSFSVQINTQNEEIQGDNEEISLSIEKGDIIDFSKTDPFSDGGF